MTFVSMQHIPLSDAYLCQDCDHIGNCARCCPSCASEAIMGLASVLNRQPEERTQVAYSRVSALAA
ncbi:MAG: hypothetical protein WAL75_11705 [Terracidiphilus sp.]